MDHHIDNNPFRKTLHVSQSEEQVAVTVDEQVEEEEEDEAYQTMFNHKVEQETEPIVKGSTAIHLICKNVPSNGSTTTTKALLNEKFERQERRVGSPSSCSKRSVQYVWRESRKLLPRKQLIFAVIWYIICAYFNTVCQILVQEMAQDELQTQKPLIDLGFKILPSIESHRLSDIALLSIVLPGVLRCLALGRPGLVVLRRFCFIHGVIFFLRGCSIALTVLPNPFPNCRPNLHPNRYIAAFLIIVGKNHTCADVFFSGHAVSMTLVAMFWTYYTHNRYVKILLIWPSTVLGCLTLIATKFHYTNDVLYGILIAMSMWYLYHHATTLRSIKSLAIMQWFESDARTICEKEARTKPPEPAI